MRRLVLLSAAVVILLTSLVASTPVHGSPPSNPAVEFFPIAVNAHWTYWETIAGQMVAAEEWRVRSVAAGVYRLEVQTLRYDSLAKRDASGRRMAAVNEEYVVVNADGIARTQNPGALEPGEYVIRNPIAVGTNWGDERNRCRISALGVTDALSGATYADCAEVTCEAGHPTAVRVVSRFARGVGLVSQQVTVAEALFTAGAIGTDMSGLAEELAGAESLLVLKTAGERTSDEP